MNYCLKTVVICALLQTGCSDQLSWNGRNTSSDHNQTTIPFTFKPIETQLETIVLGQSRVPVSYNGDPLALSLVSNEPAAQFECRAWPATQFVPCPSSRQLRWDYLTHGQSVTIDVRSRVDDRVDVTPARVSFLVDRINGQALVSQNFPAAATPQVDLPVAEADSLAATEPRTLALGRFAAVVVPSYLSVASFSTTATYNQTLALNFNPSLSPMSQSCSRPWEMTRQNAGRHVCFATPTRDQYLGGYTASRPFDHVEMLQPDGAGPVENIVIGSFASMADLAANGTPSGFNCVGNRSSGTLPLEGWKGFFDTTTTPRLAMDYCILQGHGEVEYVARVLVPQRPGATATHDRQGTETGPFLVVWYRVNAKAGVFSWNQLQTRLGDYLNKSLIATAPVGS